MKDFRLHLIVLILIVVAEKIGNLILIVVAEKIGNISITVGVGKIVLLPMMYALLMGVATAPRFTKISSEKNVKTASSLLGVTLMLLMARYGTLVGPSLPKILAASPALILQEFGNLGTIIIGVPLAVFVGLKREAIGAAHSVAREPNVALIGERFGRYGYRYHLLRSDGQPGGGIPAVPSLRAGYGCRRRLCQYDDRSGRFPVRHVPPDGRPDCGVRRCLQHAVRSGRPVHEYLDGPALRGMAVQKILPHEIRCGSGTPCD